MVGGGAPIGAPHAAEGASAAAAVGDAPAESAQEALARCLCDSHGVWATLGEAIVRCGDLDTACAACELVALISESRGPADGFADVGSLGSIIDGPWWCDGELVGGLLRTLRHIEEELGARARVGVGGCDACVAAQPCLD